MRKKIIAVFKTHFDYGYTDLAENVLRDFCGKKLEGAVDICERTAGDGNRRYIWTLPSFLLMQMYKGCDKVLKKRLEKAVERDQIVCHALPFTMHTELLDEKLLRQMFRWTDEYAEVFSKPFPIAAKMTDVPGHTSAIVSPLVERGVKFLHIGKNEASLAPEVPPLFWWEDLKGRRILTMYNQNYGSSLLPPKGWKYPVWLALCQTYDNVGVQEKGYIDDIFRRAEGRFEICTGSLDDFARELLKCDLSGLPVVKGELSSTWAHGNGSYPRAMSLFRRCREEFYRLEAFAAEKNIDIARESRIFYENALIFCEHTFGINILKYFGQNRAFDKEHFSVERKTRPEYALAEKSWREQEERVRIMAETASGLKIRLCSEESKKSEESLSLQVRIENGKAEISYENRRYTLFYEYRIFGAREMSDFQRRYLTRFFDWSISDFGRNYYPEIPSETFLWRPEVCSEENGKYCIRFHTPPKSVSEYGNFREGRVLISRTREGLNIVFSGVGKDAVPLLEAGNFVIDTHTEGRRFEVEQGGIMVDVDRNIVKNANRILWSVDKCARIDDVILQTPDAPLVSFGKNAILQFNGGRTRKKKTRFVINLFNNQWGTNFPQWTEGDFSFSFRLVPVGAQTEEKIAERGNNGK